MATFLQLIISGLAMGFIYSLVAIEYTLIWNATGLLNFSHDKFITLGAYFFVGTYIMSIGLPPMLAALLTIITMFIFGVLVAYGVLNPLRQMSSNLFALIGTVVLGRIILESIRLIWGPMPFRVDGFLEGTLQLGSFTLSKAYAVILVTSVLFTVGLTLFMKHTKMGKAMRCVSCNQNAAALMGINVKRNIAFTVGLSAVICAIIGILTTPIFNVELNMASMIGLKGFTAGVIGGFGTLPGAILGGVIIGLVENFSVLIVPAVYKDSISFILLIVFLLVKPNGILAARKEDC